MAITSFMQENLPSGTFSTLKMPGNLIVCFNEQKSLVCLYDFYSHQASHWFKQILARTNEEEGEQNLKGNYSLENNQNALLIFLGNTTKFRHLQENVYSFNHKDGTFIVELD